MLHRARTHTLLPLLQPSACNSGHQITLSPSLGWAAWSDSPDRGELVQSLKPFQNESTLAKLRRLPTRRPGASRLPYPGSEQLPGASPERPETATLWRALGGHTGRRAESPGLLPRAAAAVAAVRSGLGRPLAAGGPARSRPGDAGQRKGPPAPPASPSRAEREVSVNKCKLLGPPGQPREDLHARPTQPPAWVGFAAAGPGA